jgi:hypothetical protein
MLWGITIPFRLFVYVVIAGVVVYIILVNRIMGTNAQ